MDEWLVGGLAAITLTIGTLYWHLLVRPEVLLMLWQAPDDPDWFEHHPAALRALRWSTGALVFLLGLLTGIIVIFLVRTR